MRVLCIKLQRACNIGSVQRKPKGINFVHQFFANINIIICILLILMGIKCVWFWDGLNSGYSALDTSLRRLRR